MIGDPALKAFKRDDEAWLPQSTEQRVDTLGCEMRFGKGADRQPGVVTPRLVPCIEDIVDQGAAQRRVAEGIATERVETLQS